MTFANVNNVEMELPENYNAFWIVISVTDNSGNTGFVAVDAYNMRIAMETNEVIWDYDTILYSSKVYSSPVRLLEDIGLSGPANENPWVTEAMPLDLYGEIWNKYGYALLEVSLDTK